MLHNKVVLQGTTPTEAPTITEGVTVVATKVEEATTQVAPVHPVRTGPIETADALKADSQTTGKITIPVLSHHPYKKACASAAEGPQHINARIVGITRQIATTAERRDTSLPFVVTQSGKTPQQAATRPTCMVQ